MIKVDCPQKQIDRRRPFRPAILVIVLRTKLVFDLEQEFERNNQYMKFGRNPIKK